MSVNNQRQSISSFAKTSKSNLKKQQGKDSNFALEKILGCSVTNPPSLSVHPTDPIISYSAGATAIIYNTKKNKQTAFLTAANHWFDPALNSVRRNHSQAFGGVKAISAVCFSPDGTIIAVGECGHQPRILLWDYLSGILISDLSGHKFGVTALAFSPNSKYLVSVGFMHDGNVFVWNWRSGTRVASSRVSSITINSLAFEPSGQSFVTAGQRHIKFWSFDSESNSQSKFGVMGVHKNSTFMDVACVGRCTYAITEKGLLVLFGDGRLMEKWVELKVNGGFCISASDKYLVCGCSDGIIRLFEPETLRYLATVPRPHQLGIDIATSTDIRNNSYSNAIYPDVVAVRIDPSSERITAVYSDHSLFVWDVSDPTHIGKYRSFLNHSDCVWGVEMHPNLPQTESNQPNIPPNTFITFSSDGTSRFWNLEISHQSPLAKIASSIDSPSIQAFSPTILQNNVYSRELIKILYLDPASLLGCKILMERDDFVINSNRAGVRSLKVSPDGKWLASGDKFGNIKINKLDDFSQVAVLEAHEAEVLSIDFSRPQPATGEHKAIPLLMATTSRDRLIHIFQISDGNSPSYNLVQTLDDHSSSITCVKFSEGGSILLSCAADKSLIFRTIQPSMDGGVEFATYHNASGRSTVYDMDVDASEKFVASVSQDRRLNVHSVRSGKLLRSYKPVPETADGGIDNGGGAFIKVSLDPSGLYAVTASSDKIIRVVDFYSGECVGRMAGHSEIITSVVFSKDGSRIVSTGGDGCIFVWKVGGDVAVQIRKRLLQIGGEEAGAELINTGDDDEDVDFISNIEGHGNETVFDRGYGHPANSVFRYSESGLPSWARSGYDPAKSLVPSSKKAAVPATGSSWAERIGAVGGKVELFSELPNDAGSRPDDNLRYIIEVSPEKQIPPSIGDAEQREEEIPVSDVKSDDGEDIIQEEIFYEDNNNSTDAPPVLSFTIENEVPSAPKSEGTEVDAAASVADSVTSATLATDETTAVESSIGNIEEGVAEELTEEVIDNHFEQRELGNKTFEEYMDQPLEAPLIVDVRKSMTAQHLTRPSPIPSDMIDVVESEYHEVEDEVEEDIPAGDSITRSSTPFDQCVSRMSNDEDSQDPKADKRSLEVVEPTLVQNSLELASLSEVLTRRLTDTLNKGDTGRKIEYEKLHAVLSQAHAATLAALGALEDAAPELLKSKSNGMALDSMIDSGHLKTILETYSDILVELVRIKVKE